MGDHLLLATVFPCTYFLLNPISCERPPARCDEQPQRRKYATTSAKESDQNGASNVIKVVECFNSLICFSHLFEWTCCWQSFNATINWKQLQSPIYPLLSTNFTQISVKTIFTASLSSVSMTTTSVWIWILNLGLCNGGLLESTLDELLSCKSVISLGNCSWNYKNMIRSGKDISFYFFRRNCGRTWFINHVNCTIH